MFVIKRILNHNAIIGARELEHKEYLVLGNGIAFGKKVNDIIKTKEDDIIYQLKKIERESRL